VSARIIWYGIASIAAKSAGAGLSGRKVNLVATMKDITEKDWRVFKGLRKLALERFCDRVLSDIASIGSDETRSKHERYLAIYRLVDERDSEIETIFAYLRRSTAFRQIRSFRSNGLLTGEELRQFSPELVKRVENFLESTR